MKMMILSPGPLSTIQDAGRFGSMSTGFSPGGAMDSYSMKLANLLVGNTTGIGAIEMTMMGISARFDCDTLIAITGADMEPCLNEEPMPMYQSVAVHKGDILTMGMAKNGMRSYLAVAGGFDLPYIMGSQSTNLKCKLGGFQGRKLQKGDELTLLLSVNGVFAPERKLCTPTKYMNEIVVRVMLGPQDDYFTDKGIATFLGNVYTVTDQSDRMGIRLDGQKIENVNGVDIISDGIATGSIQIPASGTPIIMMADRQTTGGYAKIATVISADLKLVAQARPGTRIRFAAVTELEAVKLRRQEEKQLAQYEYTMLTSK